MSTGTAIAIGFGLLAVGGTVGAIYYFKTRPAKGGAGFYPPAQTAPTTSDPVNAAGGGGGGGGWLGNLGTVLDGAGDLIQAIKGS